MRDRDISIDTNLCLCGCGLTVRNKYAHGHNTRVNHPNWKGGRYVDKDGYVMVYCPGHPRARDNHVLEHILVMEKKLGRNLENDEEVDHINKIRHDNRAENIRVIKKSDHVAMHNAKDMGRRVCNICGHSQTIAVLGKFFQWYVDYPDGFICKACYELIRRYATNLSV